MDVIYHRNCLDGVFSAYLFYIFSRLVTQQDLQAFKKYFQDHLKQEKEDQSYEKNHDLTPLLIEQEGTKPIIKNIQKTQKVINQQFFHNPSQTNFNAYSIFAGEYFPLKFPGNNKILFILDTNLVNQDNIKNVCERYELVILIDHHTSFNPIRKNLMFMQIKKLYLVFTQKMCAAQLCLQFLNIFFQFNKWFQPTYVKDLEKMIGYVGNNDMKLNESKQSKSFILGFYYFDLQLSHMNPLLFKRIGMINLDYLMQKGKSNLYKHHLNELIRQIERVCVGQFIMSGNLKGLKCYMTDPINPAKISDIGTIMAYLSAKSGMQNLSILTISKGGEIRISTRSHRKFQAPLALKVAQRFEGGGHTLAAGFKTSSNKLKSSILKHVQKQKITLSVQEIEQILFCNESLQHKYK